MATITHTPSYSQNKKSLTIVWANLRQNDVGDAVEASSLQDKTVDVVVNAAGVGDTVILQGSNDGVNWHTLTNPQDADLSFTGADMKVVMQNPKFIRPNVTGGDGTTDLTVNVHGTNREGRS